jgi:hypothetical protein
VLPKPLPGLVRHAAVLGPLKSGAKTQRSLLAFGVTDVHRVGEFGGDLTVTTKLILRTDGVKVYHFAFG